MQVDKIIEYLKTKSTGTIFSTRIAGASEFDAVEDEQRLAVPSLFCLLAPCTTENIQRRPNFQCVLKETLYVMCVLDAQPDRRGQTPQQQIHSIKWWLMSVLQGWSPDTYWEGLYIESDTLWKTTPSRYYHYFSFSQWLTIDEDALALKTEGITDFRRFTGEIDITGGVEPIIPKIDESGLYLVTVGVSGAGTTALNQDFTHTSGEYVTSILMRPIFKVGTYQMLWNEDLQRWEIKDSTKVYYKNLSNSQFPPVEGWSVEEGQAPAPVITHKE